jgi:hypothetical protein
LGAAVVAGANIMAAHTQELGDAVVGVGGELVGGLQRAGQAAADSLDAYEVRGRVLVRKEPAGPVTGLPPAPPKPSGTLQEPPDSTNNLNPQPPFNIGGRGPSFRLPSGPKGVAIAAGVALAIVARALFDDSPKPALTRPPKPAPKPTRRPSIRPRPAWEPPAHHRPSSATPGMR